MTLPEKIVSELINDLEENAYEGQFITDEIRERWIKIVRGEISEVIDAVLAPVELILEEEDEA